MKKILFLLSFCCFLMAQCHKTATPDPEPDLPPATQEGKAIIGCYINGKPWWPKPYLTVSQKFLQVCYGCGGPQSFGLSGLIPNGKNSGSLTVYVPFNAKKGDNEIYYDKGPSSYVFVAYDSSFVKYCSDGFRLDTTKTRRLTITKLDTIGIGILSGTFEFTAFNTCGDTLRFTQGRFDY